MRWDPNRENSEFLQQSAVLYANYYSLQISVHRTFVTSSSSQKSSGLTFPSLSICMNAARSLSHLAKCPRERLGPIAHHLMVRSPPRGRILLLFSNCVILDAGVHSWGDSPVQHLGWEVGGDGYRPQEGNGGHPFVYECA